jgi:hypothetical protein
MTTYPHMIRRQKTYFDSVHKVNTIFRACLSIHPSIHPSIHVTSSKPHNKNLTTFHVQGLHLKLSGQIKFYIPKNGYSFLKIQAHDTKYISKIYLDISQYGVYLTKYKEQIIYASMQCSGYVNNRSVSSCVLQT